MTIYRKIAAVFLGCLLSSGSAFADWQIQAQGKDGSWRGVKTGLPTEKHARYEAKIACIRSKSPLKIIETDTGKEYKLYCDPKTGRISDNDKPAPVVLLTEPQASERAKLVKKQCLGNYFMQSMLDCGCIENKAKAELLQSEARISPDAILRKVSNPPVNKACINRTGIYQYTHDSCVSVMKTPTDVEKFCGCTADVTVAGFVKDPTLNNYHYEKLRDAAMRQCGLGKSNRRIPAS